MSDTMPSPRVTPNDKLPVEHYRNIIKEILSKI